MADSASDLDRRASLIDAATSGQSPAPVAARTAGQLNAQWAPHEPAFSAESVSQQRGPDRFGGWGGVLIGNLIAINVAKSMLVAPNNTLTPARALALATQEVMDARQGQRKTGWGQIAQDLTGQKLGSVMKGVQAAAPSVTGQSRSPGQSQSPAKGAKEAGQSSAKGASNADRGFSNAFDASGHTAGVAVGGPGAGAGLGRGHDKDVTSADGAGGKDAAGHGGPGGEGHGGGNGGGGGGGKGK